MRSGYPGAGEEVRFTTVCTPTTSAANVESYATHEESGEEPGPSTWPIVVDTTEIDAFGRYCAVAYSIVVLGTDGVVTYHRLTNLTASSERQALTDAIDAALGAM